jgi:hypothetical protein
MVTMAADAFLFESSCRELFFHSAFELVLKERILVESVTFEYCSSPSLVRVGVGFPRVPTRDSPTSRRNHGATRT